MVYAILLDIYKNMVGADEYAVTYSGTLKQCRAQTHHDGGYDVWKSSDFTEEFSEPCELIASSGSQDTGQILGLEPAYGLISSTLRKFTIPVAAGLAAGLAIGRMVWSGRDKK